jgi:large subunit ribosomal protein L24
MAGLRIKAEDNVIVISGKDKGKTGRVIRVDREKGRVFVEGLNMIKRHQKPTQLNPNAQAGVIEREGPIHVSNVALVDPKQNKPTRVGIVRREDGRRIRVAKRSGTEMD